MRRAIPISPTGFHLSGLLSGLIRPGALAAAGLLLLLLSAPALPRGDAADLLAKLRKKYDRIGTLSLSFTQSTLFAVSRARQESQGALSLAKGNRYRIAFDDRVIVSDGSTVWSWSKANAQVIVDRFRDDPNSLTPERLLVKIPSEYAAASLGNERVSGKETAVLKLTPGSALKGQSFRWIKLWVDEDDLTIVKFQLLDIAENEITYELRGVAIDRGIPDSTFRFTVPPGAELLDLR